LRAQIDGLGIGRVPESDALRQRIEEVRSLVERLERTAPEGRESVLAAHAPELTGIRKNVGQKDNWGGGDGKEAARQAANEIIEALASVLKHCREQALAAVLALIIRFVEEEAACRAREGLLTFDDLIVMARDILRASPSAVSYLRSRYDVMLIDEFQDTDPLQVEIALAFATDPTTRRLDRGRLFVVGDPKQSIYRFRRADMAVYWRAVETMRKDGASMESLLLNRRSRPEVLSWVNGVFEHLIGKGGYPSVQPPYRRIEAKRAASLKGPGVAWFGSVVDARSPEVRQLESEEVAARCLAVLEEGWEVEDKTGSVRPARFGDIAVLIRTRAILGELERAFAAAGVPYRIEGGSLVYRTQEVRDLMNCLAAIDDPADEVAVVGALRSAAFACSDRELVQHKQAGGGFNYTLPLNAGEPRVLEALRTLARYHRERHGLSLAALVERFAAERQLAEAGIAVHGDRNAFRRVRFVIEQARAFEADEPQSVRAFIAWMERRSQAEARDLESASLDDDEDAVRILTIHAAKGLEFPIVILAGLGVGDNPAQAIVLMDRDSGKVGVSIGSDGRNNRFTVGPYDDLKRIEGGHLDAEGARLLYVAATRARDHLLVSLYCSSRVRQSLALRLMGAPAAQGAPEHVLSRRPSAGRRPAFAGVAVDLAGAPAPSGFDAWRQALISASRRRRYTSATALKQLRAEEREEENPDETEPWARGRAGTHLGRAVHAAIQSLPLDAMPSQIEAAAKAQAVAEAIPHRHREVAELVRRALASQAAERARKARRALRELPFAFQHNGLTVEGFVDMLIETPDGLEIVDWKTDVVSVEELPLRLESYKLQAALYVRGVWEACGKLPQRVTYVFVSAGAEVSPGEPGELLERAGQELARAG
jgi:ATP-dependent helicase/nuclease subunit A